MTANSTLGVPYDIPASSCSWRPRMAAPGTILGLPALEVRQGDGSTLYSFAVDGKQLALFTTISRIHRDDDSEIQGYQRPAVLSHISAIRRYIESDTPMIPNALVIAFDKRVQFEPLAEAPQTAYARHGTLTIPVSEECGG